MEFLTIGQAVLQAGSWAVTIALLVILAVPSLKKKFFGNGENTRFDELESSIKSLGGNHMAHLEAAVHKNTEAVEKLHDKVIELQLDENKILTDIRIAVEKHA